jgi:hypothetical protein
VVYFRASCIPSAFAYAALVERRAFMKLPMEERRQRLAEQAARMQEHYARDREWEELDTGELDDA